MDVFAAVTVSQTKDNWPGSASAHPEAGRDPGLGPDVVDWTSGISDLDVPVRGVASGTVDLTPWLQATTSYRFRSGRPFTPGFRAGFDANGDGSGFNDPAHVPDAQTLGSIGQEWPCLTEQSGQFAARNSCRGPAVHQFDVQAAFDIPVEGATLTFEALNVLDGGEELLDGALWLLDGPVPANTSGQVQIPYVINPDFGQPLRRLGIGRVFRVGVRIDFQ